MEHLARAMPKLSHFWQAIKALIGLTHLRAIDGFTVLETRLDISLRCFRVIESDKQVSQIYQCPNSFYPRLV
jgi:hypothetical protein